MLIELWFACVFVAGFLTLLLLVALVINKVIDKLIIEEYEEEE